MAELAETLESPAEHTGTTAMQLPEPAGFRLLVALPEVDEKTQGGILKAVETMQVAQIKTICGFVLKIGPDAYKDSSRFPSGPYCEEGDWVIFRSYSGTRVKIHEKEFRLINDDTVEAVVQDPRGVMKA